MNPTLTQPKYGEKVTAGYAPGESGVAKYNVNDGSLLSPTVITDANIRENTIPDIGKKIQKYTAPSPTQSPAVDSEGNPVTSPSSSKPSDDYTSLLETFGLGGTSAKDVENATQNDPSFKQFNDIFKRASSSNDDVFRETMDQIKRNTGIKMQRAQQGGQALNSVLMASGASRYAPGGAITAKTRYDLDHLNEIQDQEADAISKAKEAYSNKDMELAGKLLEQVDTIRGTKQKVAESINEKITEENKAAREAEYQATRNATISGLIEQGITDPVQISKVLNESAKANGMPGTDFTSKEIADTIKDLLPTGPGIVGEYQFYKRETESKGQVPVDFNTYQNQDANRKKSIAAASVAGLGTSLNPKQVAVFNGIVDKYNKSPLVAANDRANALRTLSDAVESDPTNASLQVSFIYGLIQALDTYQSSVREGEIGLVSGTQGLAEKISNIPSKIANGNPLAPSKINEYVATAKILTDAIEAGAKKKAQSFNSQAKLAGIGDAFSQYVSEINSGTTMEDVQQSEAGAERSLGAYLDKNPEKKLDIDTKISTMESAIGRSISAAEFLQAFPEYK